MFVPLTFDIFDKEPGSGGPVTIEFFVMSDIWDV